MLTQVAGVRAPRGVRVKPLAGAIALLAGAWALPQVVLAVEPGNVTVGPVNITPTVEAETRYIDNLYRTRSSELSTWSTQVAPEIQAWVQSCLLYTSDAADES